MKKHGMSEEKLLLSFIVFIIFSTVICALLEIDKLDNYGRGILATLGVTLSGICLLLFLYSVGNIVRYLLWRKRGYKELPLFVMLFKFNCKTKPKFTLDFAMLEEFFIPKDYVMSIQDSYNVKEVSKEILTIERKALIIQFVFLVIVFAGSSKMGKYFFY